MEKRKTVLASVEEFCNECRNNLFQIRQRYEKLKANLEFDYRNGKVSPKDYEKFKNAKIDEYVPSNYTLSLDEVNYVKKYASLNSSGEMMATLIDKKYLDYLDNLKVLYASVTTFSFFGSFSLDDRKSLFKDELQKDFDEKVSALRGSEDKRREELKVELVKRKAIVDRCNEEQFYSCLERFYGIDYNYYAWFKKMALKDEFDNGFVFAEHVDVAADVVIKKDELCEVENEKRSLEEELYQGINLYHSFVESIINYHGLKDTRSLSWEFWKKKDNFYDVFRELFGIPGVIKYFKTFNSIDDDIIHIDECYKTYIDKVYNGNVSGVDKHSFVKTLFENVLNYFKERLAELKMKIDECNEKIDIISKGLDGASQHSLEEAQLQRDIYLNLDSFNDLRLPGILDEDLTSIYEDLKEIVCREHSMVCSADTAVRKTK